jgi:ectoine hydroxylase
MTGAASAYRSRLEHEPTSVPRFDPVVWGQPTAGPLDVRSLERFERDGFLVFERLFGAAHVDALRAEVERLAHAPDVVDSERSIEEPASREVRSVFEVHRLSAMLAELFADDRLTAVARQLLGSEVYIHQSRVNRKRGFRGREFYWHSDFETWHFEDGMPRMRALSMSISLTPNRDDNGSLMIIPGSHQTFVGCRGATPPEHFRQSLRAQEYGVPGDDALAALVADRGITTITGPPGSVVVFDCNAMHGSNSNITPFDRCNIFVVYNSVENRLGAPVGGTSPRPAFLAARD